MIITLDEYKAYAGITDAGFDARLTVLIAGTQRQLERACGRVFDEVIYQDEPFNGTGDSSFWIPHAPVATVTAIKTVDDSGVATTVDASSYRVSGAMGEIVRLSSSDALWGNQMNIMGVSVPVSAQWPDGMDNLLASFTGGYSANDMPDDLKLLMYTLVDSVFDDVRENWKLGATGDGAVSKSVLNPLDLSTKYADMVRPWVSRIVW